MPTTISGSTGITTDGLIYSGASAPALFQDDNRIINGSFDFWQRGTSSTSSGYLADRWQNDVFGGTVTTSRQSFTVGDTLGSNSPTYFLRQSVSGQSLTTHYAQFRQKIEGVRSYAGQTITLLGWARRSSGTGNMAVEFGQSFGTGGSPSAGIDGIGVTTVTLTESWAAFAVTVTIPSIVGKTLGTNNDDFLSFQFWTSAGSNYNARTNSLGLQTINVDFWGLHIRVGTHTAAAASLYRAPELGPELARCQRYYLSAAMGSFVVNPSNVFTPYIFPTTMRAIPAVTVTPSSGTVTLGGTITPHGFHATGSATLACAVAANAEL